jgi:hypothetical protein
LRCLWFGLVASYPGEQFTGIALLCFVLKLTGSVTVLGLVVLCFGLPGIATGPWLAATSIGTSHAW